MTAVTFQIRPIVVEDLNNINRVIEAAVMSWNLPERVKRLSLSSYLYTLFDLDHFEFKVAKDEQQKIVAVAAWEQADNKDTPARQTALLLHGIYVDPTYHRKGIGHQLFQCAEESVRGKKYDGLLVKAQEDANEFFISEGMRRLPIEDSSRQYANRYWKRIDKM